MSDTDSDYMVDLPSSQRRRKKLVINRKRQQSLPPNLSWTAPLQIKDIPQRSPGRARSVQTTDTLPRKRTKSPGRRLALKSEDSSSMKRSSKRHKAADETGSETSRPLNSRSTFLEWVKRVVLFLLTLFIGGVAFQIGKPFISLLQGKLSCHGRIAANFEHFERELDDNLFGQHVAKQVILSVVPDYVGNAASHPLVIAMNGGTGVGKNHISNIVASELNTSLSKIIIPLHFPYADESQAHFYQMQKMVEGSVRKCAVNILLIDEIDKASSGAIFGLITVLNKLKETMRRSGAKLIVLLLSNSFGHDISMYVYEETAVKMRKRDSLTYAEMGAMFTNSNHKADPSVMWYREIKNSGLLNYTVPFLPLMKKHVHLCVYRDLRMKHIGRVTPDLINKIANELPYFPEKDQIFSKTGCKRVSDKVNYIML